MSNLFKLTPALKAVITDSANRIFGNLPVVPYKTGNKIWRQKPLGPTMMDHYVPDMTRMFKSQAPEFETEERERRIAALANLKRTGRGPPKKGQGKRSQRKKK